MSEITVRDAARQMGLRSASTLMRIEQGASCDGETLALILRWLLHAESAGLKKRSTIAKVETVA
jgi:hypothetical protein